MCHDILPNMGDANASQVSLSELQERADVLSLHTPWTPETDKMINWISLISSKIILVDKYG